MTTTQNRLFLIPDIFSTSKKSFIINTMLILIQKYLCTLFITAKSALSNLLFPSVTGAQYWLTWLHIKIAYPYQSWDSYLQMQCCHPESKLFLYSAHRQCILLGFYMISLEFNYVISDLTLHIYSMHTTKRIFRLYNIVQQNLGFLEYNSIYFDSQLYFD